MHPPAAHRRAGFGLSITGVLMMALVLFALALASSLQGDHALTLSARSLAGERCRRRARDHLTLALHRLRASANQEGTEAFALLRPGGPRELELPAQEPLASEPGWDHSPVAVEVLRRGVPVDPDGVARAQDRVGVLRLRCSVESDEGGAALEVAEYGFRVSLAAPPRPFDAPTVAILDADALLSARQLTDGANATMRYAVGRLDHYTGFLENLGRELGSAANRLRSAPDASDVADRLAALAADIDAARTTGWPVAQSWTLEPAGSPTDGMDGKVHEFDEDPVFLSYADDVDLESLDLPRRVGGRLELVLDQAGQLRADRQALGARLRSVPSDPDAARAALGPIEAATRALVDTVLEHARALDELLAAYSEFQDALVEVGGARAEALREALARDAPDSYRRRAPFRFEGAGAAARAEAFLDSPGLPPPGGVVFVDDPGATLRVRIRGLSGRLLVVATGDVVIEEVRVTDPTADVFSVIAYGRLDLRDGLESAGAVARGDAFTAPSGGYRGNLVLEHLDAAGMSLALAGTVTRQEALPTSAVEAPRPAPAPAAFHVVIAPAALHRRGEI